MKNDSKASQILSVQKKIEAVNLSAKNAFELGSSAESIESLTLILAEAKRDSCWLFSAKRWLSGPSASTPQPQGMQGAQAQEPLTSQQQPVQPSAAYQY